MYLLNHPILWAQGHSYDENNDAQKTVFDLGAFVGDLTVDEDASRYVCLSSLYMIKSHLQVWLVTV